MKKCIVGLLLFLFLVSLTACGEKVSDYTVVSYGTDCIITEYYTEAGHMYQSAVFDRETRINVITTYYWTISDDGTHARILDRVEIVRINEKGELVP